MSELLPSYSLKDAIGMSVDRAIQICAPTDRITWDTTWVRMNTPQGPQLTGMLILTIPSAILGQGRLILGSGCDLNRLAEENEALEFVRQMIDKLRQMKVQQLSMHQPPNGAPG